MSLKIAVIALIIISLKFGNIRELLPNSIRNRISRHKDCGVSALSGYLLVIYHIFDTLEPEVIDPVFAKTRPKTLVFNE
jgi:hypothetical protein